MARVYRNQDLAWRGDWLYLGRRRLAGIVCDAKYPTMWRVVRLDGTRTDMVNIVRARDAARALALSILNTQETSLAEPSIEQNHRPLVG